MEPKDDSVKIPEIPEGVRQAIEEVQKAREEFAKLFESISPALTGINDLIKPIISPEISAFVSPDVQRERNEWDRHAEVLETQTAVLSVQKELLKEQRENTILSVWVLRVGIATLIVTILGVGVAIYSLFYHPEKVSNLSNTQEITPAVEASTSPQKSI